MAAYKVLLLDGIDPAGIEVIQGTRAIEPIAQAVARIRAAGAEVTSVRRIQ